MLSVKIKQAIIILITWVVFTQISFAASAPNLVYGISLTPVTPNILKFNQNITVRFKYDTNHAAGVRIFPRPMTFEAATPNAKACGSPLYPMAIGGTGTCTFTITSGNARVNPIRFRMFDAVTGVLIHEISVPVEYQFR